MIPSPIRFPCPSCGARVKAPVQLAGRTRDCPTCSYPLVIPRSTPNDVIPNLTPAADEDWFALGETGRDEAAPARKKPYPSRQGVFLLTADRALTAYLPS